VFIVGCGRSGTTLLLSILSADPRLFCINQETEGFLNRESAGPIGRFLGKLRILWMMLWQQETLEGRACWVEKTPRHGRSVETIRKAYRGRVKFIHLVRDGRDVITSKLPGRETFHISASRWIREVSVCRQRDAEPDFLVIRYEDLIRDFGATVSRIYRHLGMPDPEELRDFKAKATLQRHHAWPAELQDLHEKSIGRWRSPELSGRIADFLALPGAKELLAHYGYGEDGGGETQK
jgi:hypothetical protein